MAQYSPVHSAKYMQQIVRNIHKRFTEHRDRQGKLSFNMNLSWHFSTICFSPSKISSNCSQSNCSLGASAPTTSWPFFHLNPSITAQEFAQIEIPRYRPVLVYPAPKNKTNAVWPHRLLVCIMFAITKNLDFFVIWKRKRFQRILGAPYIEYIEYRK